MPTLTLNITPLRPSEIPADGAIISAAKSLLEESVSWKLGKAYHNDLVQTAHAVLPDGLSWHSRVSRHSVPFDQFWAILGHQWMPAKKAFNDQYIYEIKKVTLVKTLSPTASIWTILYGFPTPLSPRIFTVLQVTHLEPSTLRTGWVVHIPIDSTGPGDEELLAKEDRGVKGRYACVEKITELPNGRTEWRLVTSSTPAGLIPKSLGDKTLPARISLDVASFMDWYYTCYLKTGKFEKALSLPESGYTLSTIGFSLALLNVLVYIVLYRTSLAPSVSVRAALGTIWGPGLYVLYKHRTKRSLKDVIPKQDRLLIGMRDPMIPATIELSGTLSLAKATDLITSRLLTIPRMSDRLVLITSDAPYWERCTKVDVDAHLREYRLAPGSGYIELRELIERLSRAPIDPARPPWDVSIIHRPQGGSVLFTRVHHAITDGRGVTDILLACSDEITPVPSLSSSPAPTTRILSRLAQTARNIKDLRNLDRPVEPLSSIKRAEPLETVAMAWMQQPVGLAELRRTANHFGGGTVNDVILAAVAGALRMYMRAHGDDVQQMQTVQCKLPVDVFAESARTSSVVLGTHLSDLNVPLPLNLDTPTARYVQVRETMREAKAGYRVRMAAFFSGVVGGLQTQTRLKLIATDAKTVSCYVSNMKGPAGALHFDGIAIDNVRCHPLGLNNIGVAVAVYSYNGQVNLAVCTDKDLIDEPDVLCGFLEDELAQLREESYAYSRRSTISFLPQTPQFSSVYSVVIPSTLEAVRSVLLPADAPAIARFLVGTRDASLKPAADFIHHNTDYVRLDVRAALAGEGLPVLSALAACEVGEKEEDDDVQVLQRDCFTVIERVPVLFGLVSQTVTVKSWQVLDPARRIAVYESAVQGAGVRVWKVRELEDLGAGRTRVNETLRGVCPWVLQSVVRKDSVATHRATMDKYAAMMAV